MKTCTKCSRSWELDGFGKSDRYTCGYKPTCKACAREYAASRADPVRQNAYNRAYYAANRTRERIRSRLGKYDLSLEQYNAMWAEQSGACKICGTGLLDIGDYDQGNSRPANAACIDHCHSSGKVRGILCMPCNLMIGYAKDNPEVLKAAAKYVVQLDHIGE